ncbi:Zinc finger transcription factor YRR1 [Talaromyces islandicus]|uniref:Zinc finger transcription factor YRR1 n=1 Tax=Talaromyces islandicus TaxID=28573 RepID=A0A0U1M0J2_TALIS|nr:Zinc finger transcription factor YRR1 [Talaromyces islandicus]
MATPTTPDGHMSDASNSSASAPKSNTVCVLCRRRKVKCDRIKPSCSFCVKNGTASLCQYIASEKKRGLRAGYVLQLENRLDRVEAEIRDLKAQTAQNAHYSQAPVIPSPPSNANEAANQLNEDLPSALAGTPAMQAHTEHDETRNPSRSAFIELCSAWFDKFHGWFPILHPPTVMQTLQDISISLELSPLYVVLKAIAAVTLPHVGFVTSLSHDQRRVISAEYAQDIALRAMDSPSLPSLQAVLIVSVLEYGNELLDGSSTMGAAWNISVSRPHMTTATPSATSSSASASYMAGYQGNSTLYPCGEDIWTTSFPEFCISVASFEDLETSSSFALYVNLVANELWIVHQFLQQPFDRRSVQGRANWQAECKNVDERLQKWRAVSPLFQNGSKGSYYNPQYPANTTPGTAVNATPSAVTEISSLVNGNIAPTPEKVPFDPVAILSFAMYDMAIIALYQRLAFPANDIERPHGPFYHAIQRCLDASDELTTVVRSVSDADLESMSPHLIFPIFVAARFFLLHARITGVETPRNIDLLMYSLRVCGQRWNLARRLEKVLRAACAERQVTINFSALPPQFFDLQYSHLDIDKVLEVWADSQDMNNIASSQLVGW